MVKHLIGKCIIMAGLLLPGLVCADEIFNDPTRPPVMEAPPAVEGEAPKPEVGPVLQSVSMSKSRKTATINGQEVAIGEKFGDATLIKVLDSEVVLRNPDGSMETLRMYPQVEKTVAKPQRGATP